MSLHTTLTKVSTKLIKKFGRSVTHITVTQGEYNPDTGTSSTETTAVITAVITNYSSRDYNNVIVIGDAPMLTASEVKMGDKIMVGTKTYAVMIVDAVPVNDGIIVYQCNLRAIL